MVTEKLLINKIMWRLIPYLGLLYLIAYIDRQNVTYAKLQMVGALGISESAYGLGASLFFIGYFFFEVPSNLLLVRVGASVWFARILVSWGIVTVALAFTQNATMFYVLRFLLGACEAGFFPGVLYLITLWFPSVYRGTMIGLFMAFSAVANIIGAPLGGILLDLDGLYGIAGWEWIFIVTGIPAIAAGAITFFYLPDSPDKSRFLNPDEKRWLQDRLTHEAQQVDESGSHLWRALLDSRVLLMSLGFIAFPLAGYGLSYWLPTVVKSFGIGNTANGFLNIIPWALAIVGLNIIPRAAARAASKTPYIVIPLLVSGTCLLLSALLTDHTLQFACLSVSAAANFSAIPVFWSLASRFLKGVGAAAGLAAINSVGNLGGFIAQNVVPQIRDFTGSTIAPMFFLAATSLVGAAMVIIVSNAIVQGERRSATRKAALSS